MEAGALDEQSPVQALEEATREELKALCRIAWPVAVANCLMNLRLLISLAFLGRLGGGLALTTVNVTAQAVMFGLALALEPLLGGAYGAKDFKAMGAWLQRSLLILWLTGVPISILWLNAEPILIACAQDPAIAHVTGAFLRYLLPQVFLLGAIMPLRLFLRSQDFVDSCGLAKRRWLRRNDALRVCL
ncbi:hypothetical protein KFL_006150080 [Klebsormidium nitens]|uniref:Protein DETOXIFICATION n=1 Tax=Klebsormidium nitens TaxID=105231 RepID=A0A1Y1IN83_KLENI|nr:hypothetical protein KFL_006150080 [Klebsormidium nitens]|eukprot:GAQ90226.1 hypothetical protein KFL_006150080 [Klebsormidium nitens]